jgi:hypothetical protein
VACTPDICSALRAAGLPASHEVRLGTNVQSLSSASIVVVTPALRVRFRTNQPPDVAPVILAKYGSGSARITIQPVYPGGGLAYQAALRQQVQSRIRVGEQLLNSGSVLGSSTVRTELAAGQVDPRLLLVLQTLTSQHPVEIVSFSDAGPGASPGVPFRVAELATTDPTGSVSGQTYMKWLGSVLLPPSAAFPPITHKRLTTLQDGQRVARIQYAAPSPLFAG